VSRSKSREIEIERKIENQPKQLKVMSTPRIKLKHNDISDEEFRLLMEHQRVMTEVHILTYYCSKILFL